MAGGAIVERQKNYKQAIKIKPDDADALCNLGVARGDQDMRWVEFRNISLVPGRNFGFEIAEGELERHP